MSKILFIADIPPVAPQYAGSAYAPEWLKFAAAMSANAAPNGCVQKLSENAWLLETGGTLQFLLLAASAASTMGIPYKAFHIDGEVVEMTPKPKAAGAFSGTLRM
jgi:hypothetical protein